jgi:7,8-dihydroneopterin aldolase/epimerase/oxygenase
MSCKLEFTGLRLLLQLGWTDEERAQAQAVDVDLKIAFAEEPPACRTDRLSDTVCYGRVAEILKEMTSKRSFKLIEFLAREMHQALLPMMPSGARLGLRVRKIHPPVENLHGGASFEYGDLS